MRIRRTPVQDIPKRTRKGSDWRAGTGKWEPIRSTLIDLEEGEALEVDLGSREEAERARVALLGGRKHPSNTLYGVRFKVYTRGSVLYASLLPETGAGDESPTR